MMLIPILAAAVAATPPTSCERVLVTPTGAQGMSDAALVSAASHHDTSNRSLGVVMAAGGWRFVWATPDDSEPGVFLFRPGPAGMRFVDVWGGGGQVSRAEVIRWASRHGVPYALARCVADRVVAEGP